jgi:hypothetical protein
MAKARDMQLLRMTTRWWMVAVVITGLLLGTLRIKRRRDYFLSRAQDYASLEVASQRIEDAINNELNLCTTDTQFKSYIPRLLKDIAHADQEIGYYTAMARKYRHASRYPWLPVEPDPPAPE